MHIINVDTQSPFIPRKQTKNQSAPWNLAENVHRIKDRLTTIHIYEEVGSQIGNHSSIIDFKTQTQKINVH